jgi:hypothetical protein
MKTKFAFAALALGSALFATSAMAAGTMAPANTMAPAATMAPTGTMGAPPAGGMMAPHKPVHHKKKPTMGAMGGTMAPHTDAMAPANTMGGSH